MDGKKNELNALKEEFSVKCYRLIEEGVENKAFKMKDVAACLGISSQVASKLVNPNDPRTLTAFELFRLSLLLRKPLAEIITPNLYLTGDELDDQCLVKAITAASGNDTQVPTIDMDASGMPKKCRRCMQAVIQTVKMLNREG